MSKPRIYIILDCPFLCHRAHYSTGGLMYNNKPIGVIYGFFKTLAFLHRELGPYPFVFCWDSKGSKRKEAYPLYKENRIVENADEDAANIAFHDQVWHIRVKYLPIIGFENNFVRYGYEADDLIADVCKTIPTSTVKHKGIIVSSDHDLYQCLRPNISIWNPQTQNYFRLKDFERQYKIRAGEWSVVKAIAGCPTDNIQGVEGVGEITAVKYIRGKLGKHTKAWKKLQTPETAAIYNRNIQLVSLPYANMPKIQLKKDVCSKEMWERFCKHFQFHTLINQPPFPQEQY